jgi:hypothetical protein
MSPRHRGRGHRGGTGGGAPQNGARPATGATPRPSASDEARQPSANDASRARPRPAGPRRQPRPAIQPSAQAAPADSPEANGDNGDNGENGEGAPARRSGCTLAQMRRFIKSRPYVPLHELRRRFLIEGDEDEVTPVATDKGRFYVGLPATEAQHLAELIKAGEVGYELLLDPTSPAVVGVFPMRPVARQ